MANSDWVSALESIYDAFADRSITRCAAETQLSLMGFDPDEIAELLDEAATFQLRAA
jgi:hypothetical protein